MKNERNPAVLAFSVGKIFAYNIYMDICSVRNAIYSFKYAEIYTSACVCACLCKHSYMTKKNQVVRSVCW